MLGSESTPLKVAIVGAGPSGMYAADALFKSKLTVLVDAFDRLPTPYGLLRGGVAPDHQRMKYVSKYYDRVASNPNFSFYGNVKIGRDITVDQLKEYYDAIIVSCGAETDRTLGIPGESLDGSYAATEFVGWYNGHLDYQDRKFDFSGKSVAIIGQGNVAIDVTRILSKNQEELGESDITADALSALKSSGVETIHLIGRRGPVQAAFSQLEIKELGELADCSVSVDSKYLELSDSDIVELESNNKAAKNVEILNGFTENTQGTKKKHIEIHFLKSPLKINGADKVESITLGLNKLTGEAGNQKAESIGESVKLPVDIVFRSVGYRGVELPGVPFNDSWGGIPHKLGRVVDNDDSVVKGLHVSGWIKRGPSGVLGTNKPCSTETVNSLIEDLEQLSPASKREDSIKIELEKNNVRFITFNDWKLIDAEEIRLGTLNSKPREKFVSLESIISFLNGK